MPWYIGDMGDPEGSEGVKDAWRERLAAWAAAIASDDRAQLCAVWVFGSRARGVGRPDSDLDIGIRMVGDSPGEARGDWMAVSGDWKKSIAALFPEVRVDVWGTGPEFGDEIVWPSIERDGDLVFEVEPGAAYTLHSRVD